MTGKLRKKLEKFGFISNDQGDFFLLPSSIEGGASAYMDLNVGDTLQFEPIQTPKGWRAENVSRTATATVKGR